MKPCRHCGTSAALVSGAIGFCTDCLRGHFDAVWPAIRRVHGASRQACGLPAAAPRDPVGIPCPLCFQACRLSEEGLGYCGLRSARRGRLIGGRPHEGNLAFYFDPLPTNCVAGFVCPEGTGCGPAHHARAARPQTGRKNLAVFYQACSFNCLFCQNHHFREHSRDANPTTARALAGAVDAQTACICYFGGDPAPQILHALATARLAQKRNRHGRLRICWETNGAMTAPYLQAMADTALASGGCIKFDLKAWHASTHKALCGVSNRQTLSNFQALAGRIDQRPEPPLLVASTLLVPGYVDVTEVAPLARFIADLNPDIPYSLLAFHPQFYLQDLPTTSRAQAERCRAAAEAAGLRRVHIGNAHLL